MEYFLKLSIFKDTPIFLIDRERFLNLKLAKEILNEALEFEEEYEMVVINYMDLEKESINVSVTQMIRNYRNYIDFFDARLTLNIRLMNLLTSARLYIDQLNNHCVACLPREEKTKERVTLFFSNEYNINFDYRFMEALRNHVQHHGTPVHKILFESRWTANDDSGLMEFSSYFIAEKKLLSSDKDFKKQILDEMPDKVDLILAARGYIESISSIHSNARQMISSIVSEARLQIESAIKDYKSVYNNEVVGLSAYSFNDKTKTDEIQLFLDNDNIRIQLENRNNQLINLRKRYATGQIKKN